LVEKTYPRKEEIKNVSHPLLQASLDYKLHEMIKNNFISCGVQSNKYGNCKLNHNALGIYTRFKSKESDQTISAKINESDVLFTKHHLLC